MSKTPEQLESDIAEFLAFGGHVAPAHATPRTPKRARHSAMSPSVAPEVRLDVPSSKSGPAQRTVKTSPCTAWPGAGYLVRASYRVPPFLADDVLWVQRRDPSKQGRVHCVAYDPVWHERIPERSGWLDVDTLTPIFEPGMRVELSPTCLLWMRGRRYQCGTVRQVTKDWTVVVKLDAPELRQLQRFTDHTLLRRIG